jgi:hypothetical protein
MNRYPSFEHVMSLETLTGVFFFVDAAVPPRFLNKKAKLEPLYHLSIKNKVSHLVSFSFLYLSYTYLSSTPKERSRYIEKEIKRWRTTHYVCVMSVEVKLGICTLFLA